MGGLCTTNVQTLPDPKSVLKDTEIPEWVSTGGQKLFQQAAELAQGDFPLFQGDRISTYQDINDPNAVSKLTGREQTGLQLLEDEGDSYRPYVERAGEVASEIGQQRIDPAAFGAEDAARYSDIYTSAVQPALQDVSDVFGRSRNELNAAATKAGAYGGSRQGVEGAELVRGEARERGKILTEAGRSGLEFGAQQFERDRAAGERAFDLNQASRKIELGANQALGPLVQGLMQQQAQGLIGAGEAERSLDKSALEMAYRDYVEQREYPFTAANFALGALKGLPFETREFSLQRGGEMIQSPSVYGQTMGGLGALASAYKLLA
mgnify:CR=1 FL=1|jgi:hypothetical protein|tara:strand:- start:378 stop:1343 length:966 start_codon:yes stop_codon:yes gene_type:complete